MPGRDLLQADDLRVRLLQGLPGPLVGADVVECNPGQDPLGITAPLGAKLVKELASRMIEAGTLP